MSARTDVRLAKAGSRDQLEAYARNDGRQAGQVRCLEHAPNLGAEKSKRES
jgi:hypothetical protein